MRQAVCKGTVEGIAQVTEMMPLFAEDFVAYEDMKAYLIDEDADLQETNQDLELIELIGLQNWLQHVKPLPLKRCVRIRLCRFQLACPPIRRFAPKADHGATNSHHLWIGRLSLLKRPKLSQSMIFTNTGRRIVNLGRFAMRLPAIM